MKNNDDSKVNTCKKVKKWLFQRILDVEKSTTKVKVMELKKQNNNFKKKLKLV